MNSATPEDLGLIAGKGEYPLLLAESAKRQGVRRIVAIAFRKETRAAIEQYADEVHWLYVGQLGKMIESLKNSGVRHVVMAGQITPTHLFRVRMDREMIALLKELPERNAETIFGAVGERLKSAGMELLPASRFMEAHMPKAGVLSTRRPTEQESRDIELGMRVASRMSAMDVGQTVVMKEGTILAVEAFEGTNETLKRAGRLGGPGAVVVKVAKPGHDMRFDIPVVGVRTMKILKKIGARVLAVQAGRAILLDRKTIIEEADRIGLCLTAIEPREMEPD